LQWRGIDSMDVNERQGAGSLDVDHEREIKGNAQSRERRGLLQARAAPFSKRILRWPVKTALQNRGTGCENWPWQGIVHTVCFAEDIETRDADLS
jgi:hypothetical protein